jgi:Concanavalin A-like lectin/glucanases superfamily
LDQGADTVPPKRRAAVRRSARALGVICVAGAVFGLIRLETTYRPDGRYPKAVAESSPRLWLRLSELRGRTARDAAPLPLPGGVARYGGGVGLGVVGPLSNRLDTAAGFDGHSSDVDAGPGLGFPGRAPFTIEAWVKPLYQPAPFSRIVSKELNVPGRLRQGYDLYVDNFRGFGFERFRDGVAQALVTGRPPAFARYSHIVGEFDGRVMLLWVNGRAITGIRFRFPLSVRPVAQPLRIGRLASRPAAYFLGSLDEVAIYDRALSPREIKAHYRAAR